MNTSFGFLGVNYGKNRAGWLEIVSLRHRLMQSGHWVVLTVNKKNTSFSYLAKQTREGQKQMDDSTAVSVLVSRPLGNTPGIAGTERQVKDGADNRPKCVNDSDWIGARNTKPWPRWQPACATLPKQGPATQFLPPSPRTKKSDLISPYFCWLIFLRHLSDVRVPLPTRMQLPVTPCHLHEWSLCCSCKALWDWMSLS